jgi:hypothetical protein
MDFKFTGAQQAKTVYNFKRTKDSYVTPVRMFSVVRYAKSINCHPDTLILKQGEMNIFLYYIPPLRWPKNSETCTRIITCLYIIVSHNSEVFVIYAVKM